MPETDPRDRASTPLLTLITQQSLDEDYRHVADRRATGELPPRTRRSYRPAAVVVAAFGLLVTVAAVQTSRSAEAEDASRASLVAQIDAGRTRVAQLGERVVRLRNVTGSLQERVDRLGAEERDAAARVVRLRSTTGFGPVTGPGVRITVDDAPGGSAAVRDADLRPLVNGLWEVGAEAIAINGQRLTERTAIRNSNAAIHVNVRPLSPPYVISAIGDPRTLAARLMDTQSGLVFRDIATDYGFPVQMENEDSMSLPAAPSKMSRLSYVVGGAAAGNAAGNLDQRQKEPPP